MYYSLSKLNLSSSLHTLGSLRSRVIHYIVYLQKPSWTSIKNKIKNNNVFFNSNNPLSYGLIYWNYVLDKVKTYTGIVFSIRKKTIPSSHNLGWNFYQCGSGNRSSWNKTHRGAKIIIACTTTYMVIHSCRKFKETKSKWSCANNYTICTCVKVIGFLTQCLLNSNTNRRTTMDGHYSLFFSIWDDGELI